VAAWKIEPMGQIAIASRRRRSESEQVQNSTHRGGILDCHSPRVAAQPLALARLFSSAHSDRITL